MLMLTLMIIAKCAQYVPNVGAKQEVSFDNRAYALIFVTLIMTLGFNSTLAFINRNMC